MDKETARKKTQTEGDPWFRKSLRRAYCHKACNRQIQGSAARMTKLAMRDCWNEGLVPMLQMHDELDFSFTDKRDAIRAQEIMRDAVKLTVPVKVDAEFGRTWGEASNGRTWEDAERLRDGP